MTEFENVREALDVLISLNSSDVQLKKVIEKLLIRSVTC